MRKIAGFLILGWLAYMIFPPSKPDQREVMRNAAEKQFGSIKATRPNLTETLYALNDLTPFRMAQINIEVPLGEFGATYETQQRNARARSGAYVDQECAALLRTIAAKCQRTDDPSTSPTPDAMEFRLTLQYAQKEQTGPLHITDGQIVDEITVDFAGNSNDPATTLRPADAARYRENIYRQIAAKCREVRKIYNNCIINRVRLDNQLWPDRQGRPRVSISAEAYFTIVRQIEFDS